MASLRSGLKSAGKKLSKTFGSGKLEKACVVTYKKTGRQFKIDTKQQVQFNPSEYTIRRGVKLSSKKPLGKEALPAASRRFTVSLRCWRSPCISTATPS